MPTEQLSRSDSGPTRQVRGRTAYSSAIIAAKGLQASTGRAATMTADYGRSKQLRLNDYCCHSTCDWPLLSIEEVEALVWRLRLQHHQDLCTQSERTSPSHLMHPSANNGCRFGPHLQGTPLVTAFTARKQEASQVAGNVSKTVVYSVDREDFARTPGTAGAWRVRVHA